MDAREQAPVAPLCRSFVRSGARGREAAAQDDAFALEPRQRRRHVALAQREHRRERGRRRRPEVLHVPAHRREHRRPRAPAAAASRCAGSVTRGAIAAPGYSASIARRCSVANQSSPAVRRDAQPRARPPTSSSVGAQPAAPTPRAAGTTTSRSSRSCSSSASRGSGRASSRTRSIAASVERAEVALVLRQRAAQRHGARAALLQRRVVEVGVRLAVQDLVRERRRLGRVARVQADLAALDALQHVRAAGRCPSPRAGSPSPSGGSAGGRAAPAAR